MINTRFRVLKPSGLEDQVLNIELDRRHGTMIINGSGVSLESFSEGSGTLSVQGKSCRGFWHREGSRYYLCLNGDHFLLEEKPSWFDLVEEESNDGNLTSRMPSKVLQVHCRQGDSIQGGELLFVLESMKMETRIEAPFDGVVAEVLVSEGDMLAADQLMVRLEPAS